MEQPKTPPTTTHTPPAETRLHFLDYWRIIRVRKTVILAVFLLVVVTTTLVTMILPESYASTARIAVEKDAPDIRGLDGGPTYAMHDPYFIQTEFEKIQSKSVLHLVILTNDLNRKWAKRHSVDQLRTEETFLLLKSKISVKQSRNTSLIEITVFSDSKEEAAELANDIAEAYRQYRLSTRRSMTETGIESLKRELADLNEKINKKQLEVEDIRRTNEITDLGEGLAGTSVITLDADVLRRWAQMQMEDQREYERYKLLYDQLSQLGKTNYNALKEALPTSFDDALLKGLMQELIAAQQMLVKQKEDLGEQHASIRTTRALITDSEEKVKSRIDGIMTGLGLKVEESKIKLEVLSTNMTKARNDNREAAKIMQPYYLAKRDLDYLMDVRKSLTSRITAESVEVNLPRVSTVEIVDRAEPGLAPVRPNKPVNIALGVIIGLIVGIGLAFFIEYLDTSVKTIDDVERALQAPVLGVIPQNVGSLLDEGPDSPHAEAYRVLRTNVLFSRKNDKLNTITVVSGGAGEGKSTTLFNLATVFAQDGSRILVVDSDLRRPSIHKLLRVSNSIGLTNFLLRQNTLEEVIQTTTVPSLDFLPSGKLPSSSMGILSSIQMKELILELKRRYDFVFFDSPPIMGVSDASILASEVDLVLQVIQYRRYPQPMTIRAKQMIEKVGGNLLGIVLNNINMAQDENYYYYSGYYYDYYSKEEDPKDKDKDKKKPTDPSRNGKDQDKEKQESRLPLKQKY